MRHSPGTSDNAGNSPARPAMQGTGDRSNDLTTQPLNRTKAPTPATGVMSAAMAMPGNTACTYLTHHFGGGLDGDDRFVVERRDPPGPAPRPEGELPADGGAHRGLPQRGGATRPDRTEIIIATGLCTRGGIQARERSQWGFCATTTRRADSDPSGRPAGPAPAGRRHFGFHPTARRISNVRAGGHQGEACARP